MTTQVDVASPERLAARHRGLSPGIAAGMVEAAGVALARRHRPPTSVDAESGGTITKLDVVWRAPDERVTRAWRDAPRATEWGAEALAVVSIDALRGMIVVDRALRGSRVDFYLGRVGEGLEHAAVLEVAGTDDGSIKRLLREKLEQARGNADRLPALAAAVRFREPRILVEEVRRGTP